MKVLFVCIENSCRSQMAEAFARIHGGDGVEAYSAGSRPSGVVNPKSIESMGAIGYDMTAHRSTGLDEVPQGGYDHVITMGCGDECPFIAARHHDDWVIPDPKNMPPEEFAEVRDLIGEKVRRLLASDSAS
jgi:arsenate reductase